MDADYSTPPFVYVVVRNIGRGAAKDIAFEFSAPMEAPEGRDNPYWVPLNEQGYFARGMDYLAPGAEIRNLWGSMVTLGDYLREQGLQEGITVRSRFKSLDGRQYESQWTVNPLLIADRLSRSEPSMKDLVDEIRQLASNFHYVVNRNTREIQVSTATEREERRQQHQNQGDAEGS